MSDIGRNPEDYLSVKVADGKISKEDAGAILEHLNEASSNKGMREHTTVSNLRYIAHAVESVPGVETWTNEKISSYVSTVRKKYKANTQRKHIILTKRFCEWLVTPKLVTPERKDKKGKVIEKAVYNTYNTFLDIEAIKEIVAPAADRMTKTSAMMLRDEDVSKIIAAGRNTRDRCMISMLAESGMRPFELLDLTWSELQIDNNGVIINVSGKTGKPRFIRLITSSPYIAAWRNDHPDASGKNHIFVSLRGGDVSGRVTHSALKKVVRLAAVRAGIKKHVNPYVFRHSNVTRMLEEGYSDSTIRMVHWGSQTTQMLGTYGHVSPGAIDAEILDRAGVVRAEKKEKRKVDQCIRCYAVLTPEQKFCPTCGMPQTKEAESILDVLRTAKDDPDTLIEYAQWLKARKGTTSDKK
jgi:integrase